MIISCYNEASVIAGKIKNTLQLDYPEELLQILVMSDGSSDETADRARGAGKSRIEVVEFGVRQGKTAVQNRAVERATGEILVFSDANAMYEPDAVKNLVRDFSDPKVAGVCGEVQFQSDSHERSVGEEEEVYWGYEQFLKRNESQASSAIGANGAIYAIRQNQYELLPDEIISDLVEPLMQVVKGYRITYNPSAIAKEGIGINYLKEFHRKRRIILRSWHGMSYVSSLLNPLKSGIFSLQLWSHKILRWLMPVGLIALFFSNLFLLDSGFVYQVIFGFQLFFYGLSIGGWIIHERFDSRGGKLFRLPFYFCLVNAAALSALFSFIRGKNIILWDPQRGK